MKKLLAVLAISAFMVACNNGASTETDTTTDTTNVAPASDSTLSPIPDSTMMTPDSTVVDTTKK